MRLGLKRSGPIRSRLPDDAGSAIAEFAMVAALLTVLTLSVMQLGLALLIRNTIVDAAAEGARFGALADNSPEDGIGRTEELIATALGPTYAGNVTASTGSYLGHPAIIITVRSPLPLIGLIGVDGGLEVSGHAAIEALH
jgi:Flp pilus assembly protein TadG